MAEMRYSLPKLTYGYGDLVPQMSEQQLTLHHAKHHQAYVNGANATFELIEKSRKEGTDMDMKAALRALSFNVGGHVLHSLFWNNIAPDGSCEKEPYGRLAEAIVAEFGSFDWFSREFAQAASSVEGSGWAALAFEPVSGRLVLTQIEKHNVNGAPGLVLLLVVDVWEHAYYIDYKNDRAKYVEAVWSIINWDEVVRRYDKISGA